MRKYRGISFFIALSALALVAGTSTTGCSGSEPARAPASPSPEIDGGGGGDASAITASPCPAGEAPIPGDAPCTAVGPRCAKGFETHASGFGCVPVMPPAKCEGATREALGERACVPVGDCSRTFPPTNATVRVEKGATGTDVYDTIQKALDAAPDGAVIAVADGDWPEPIAMTRPVRLTIVGRCAEKVAITTTAGITVAKSGALTMRDVSVQGAAGIVARGDFTAENAVLSGFVDRGVAAKEGAHVSLVRTVLRDFVTPKQAEYINAVYADTGSTATLEESVITGILGRAGVAFDPNAEITLKRSIVRDIALATNDTLANGVTAFQGAALTITESVISGVRSGIIVGQGASKATVTRSTIMNVKFSGTPLAAVGLDVNDTASATTEETTFADSEGVSVRVAAAEARGTFQKTAIVGQRENVSLPFGGAFFSMGKSTFEDGVIVGAERVAIQAHRQGGQVEMRRSLIAKTGANGVVQPFGAVASMGGSLLLDHVALVDNAEVAMIARDLGSRLVARSCLARNVIARDNRPAGMALVATDDGYAEMDDCTLEGANGAAVLIDSASGYLKSGTLRGNVVAVQAQRGAGLIEGDTVDPKTPALVVSPSVRFESNGTRVGTGELPVPKLPASTLGK